jgi:Rps23 Pro-64 3,4-dihydroxylase Tpa1-like proline 4-hydroxylase
MPDSLVQGADGKPLAVRIGGLLSRGHLDALLAATLAEERWFVDASTGGSDDHRRASVLYTPVDEATEVVERLRHRGPSVARLFGCALGSRVECQQTAHRDGDFYRPHTDDHGEEASERALSWVYYFHRLPRGYEGGELCLYGRGGERVVVEPVLNELVLFPSALRHEVLPVRARSGAFADARFSVNGWLWR